MPWRVKKRERLLWATQTPALGEGGPQLVQIDPGLRRVEGQDQVGMSLDPMRALIAAHRLGRNLALTSELPAPTARACKTDPKAFGYLVPGRAGLDSMDHALPQIDGQG